MAVNGDGDKKDKKDVPVRQRKAHRKSRLGCSNCKLRSVKCDESKPSCKRCVASGFICSFTRNNPSTQLAHRSAGPVFSVADPVSDQRLKAPNPGLRIPIAQPTKGGVGELILGEVELAALERFRLRTVFTIGTEKTRHLYSQGAFNLGFKHTYLIHIFVALSLLHDTHITPNQPMPHRTALAFHWYQATVLFQQRLRAACGVDASSLPSTERDALWVAGALLGAASIALIDVHDANAVWPLKEPSALDLDWLKLSDGKKVVWNITDPTRKESIFHELILDLDNMPFGNKPVPPKALPPIFYTMFNLSPESSATSNPYHIAASLLAQLLPRDINDNTVIQFLAFLTQLDPRYRKLLEQKDPKAMVLLAWWYAKAVAHRSWWMQRRSLIEGQAICIYLEKYCKHVEGIQELVQFPKRVFGLSYTGRETKHTVGVDAARVDNPVY
ncbi:Sterol regulatory element binding [Fusarium albosuccineum]|uniref:Sterol regulatory element binding n=1 Tax=Fusarium albosuccineum TaxID=1237068 RepID=A0A8H4PG64_9HYPO|nr:Sterol regulatory element binding [Fusarium albosuccineum]